MPTADGTGTRRAADPARTPDAPAPDSAPVPGTTRAADPGARPDAPAPVPGAADPAVSPDAAVAPAGAEPAPRPYAGHRAAVHEETVDGFGTVRVLPVDPHADLDVVHGWVADEHAAYWGMTGFTRRQVLETFLHLDSLDTHHAFLAVKDGVPAALFQTYEPAADRVGTCYEVAPGDIGVHLLIGPPATADGARTGWSASLLTVFLGYALTGLDRRRAVVEPDVRNTRAVERLRRQGFEPAGDIVLPEIDLPEVHLPEKHARLAFLTRASFETNRAKAPAGPPGENSGQGRAAIR